METPNTNTVAAQGANTEKERSYSLTLKEIEEMGKNPKLLAEFKKLAEQWDVLTSKQLIRQARINIK